HHLPKGNLYKLINAQRAADPYQDMVQQRRYQGPLAVTNGGDAVRIQSALVNPTTSQTDDWLLANVNYTNWYRFHSLCEAVRNYDTWPSANKNAAWYFDTNYTSANQFNGRFWTLPWDMTDTWGPTWNAGQDLAWNGIWGPTANIHTNLQRDYRNTMRELRDLLFQPDQIQPLIDALAARIAAIAPADLQRWGNTTPSGSSYSSLPNAGPGLSQGLAGYVQDMKRFMFVGGSYSWWTDRPTVGAGGWITRLDTVAADAAIPTKPTLYYVGQPGYPLNSLTFECLPFADPQGASSFAGLQWRLAEVLDTNRPSVDPRQIPPLEWDAVWDSGLLSAWNNRISIPGTYLQTNKLYRARVRHLDNTGRWSKWSDPIQFSPTAADVVAVLRESLRFSEIMYNPPAWGIYSGDDLEFLELKNISTNSLGLGGLSFTAGITFGFTNGTTLGPGQCYLLGRNAAALKTRYPGLVVHGLYSGKLDNGGETLRLSTPAGATVLEVSYKDSPPWPVTADGLGWSLVLADPVTGTYRASSAPGGSPGAEDPPSSIGSIVINEVLTHTDPPQVDAIEVFNPSAKPVDISGWFLSDDAAMPKKYRIPEDTILSAGGYQVFSETQFNANGAGFAFSSLGDEAYLFSGDTATNLTGYVHGATFGPSENGVSFGRYVNSLGQEDFVAMASLTLGTNNSRPLVGPVVISEIMFQPPLLGTNENYTAEFIELQNITATNVPLFALDFPTNTWRLDKAVNYQFPTNILLPVEGRLLVVGFDPSTNPAALTTFRATYDLADSVPVL
ncbi:MAG TPA: lamin tail domain-containing protein, partial [Candidatus Sulfotelmatobacter sp.]|nr:lamin tail domain-containing protein [Candidatus Sulfotelmatobacter sp.]